MSSEAEPEWAKIPVVLKPGNRRKLNHLKREVRADSLSDLAGYFVEWSFRQQLARRAEQSDWFRDPNGPSITARITKETQRALQSLVIARRGHSVASLAGAIIADALENYQREKHRIDPSARWGRLNNSIEEHRMDPLLIVSAISGVLQAVQTWIAVRDRSQATAAFDSGVIIGPNDAAVRAAAAQLSSLAPPTVIDAYGQRLQKCWTSYEAIIRAPDGSYMPTEIDDATNAVKRCICRELKRLKSINGSFPPGKLADWWHEYGCA